MKKHGIESYPTVYVKDGDVEQAGQQLRRRLNMAGRFKELKRRRFYEKPGDKKRRKQRESIRRIQMAIARRRRKKKSNRR